MTIALLSISSPPNLSLLSCPSYKVINVSLGVWAYDLIQKSSLTICLRCTTKVKLKHYPCDVLGWDSSDNLRVPWHTIVPTKNKHEDCHVMWTIHYWWYCTQNSEAFPIVSQFACSKALHEGQQCACIMWGNKQFGLTIWPYEPMINMPLGPQGLQHMPQALPSLIHARMHGHNKVGVIGGIMMQDYTAITH